MNFLKSKWTAIVIIVVVLALATIAVVNPDFADGLIRILENYFSDPRS